MFEIFLFINPIGLYCYDIENKVKKVIDNLEIDDCCHFIPLANVNVIQDDMIRRRMMAQKLGSFSYCTVATNRALEEYHAIKIAYGNKKARRFLRELQQKLNEEVAFCPLELSEKVIQKLNLNVEKINQLRSSDYVKDSIIQDRNLAAQWNIKKTPTTVIFNENDASESGILLEGLINEDELANIFRPQPSIQPKNSFTELFSANHLRLI